MVVAIVLTFPFLDGRSVGQWYASFGPVGDDDIVALLQGEATVAAPVASGTEPQLRVPVGDGELTGQLTVPDHATGLVVLANGSGSGRFSPRDRHVAALLQGSRLGTFLGDLLTPAEEIDRHRVFDVGLLGERLATVITALVAAPQAAGLPIGVFGAGTGAAAALWAAAEQDTPIDAVVSRGGRPDLAGHRLSRGHAPTLLIVGGRDTAVADLNRAAQARMLCPTRLAMVPGATHLFVEPGALTFVAGLAADWFTTVLGRQGPDRIHRAEPAGSGHR
jgi:putative phosphoribosyl transferase